LDSDKSTTQTTISPHSILMRSLYMDNMNLTKAMRSKADIQLAEATGSIIEGSDFNLGGQVIECYIEAIEPALLPARRLGENVVSSRITVYASSVG
jgi:hypothetical protein